MVVELWLYDGRPPTADDIERELDLDRDRLYLTATAAQARERKDLAGAVQRSKDGHANVHFPQAMRHLVGVPTLSRTDIRVLIGRYAHEVASPARSLQLRHDAGVLAGALADVWSTGKRPETLPPSDFASPDLQSILSDLLTWLEQQSEFRSHKPLEMEVRHLLETRSPIAPVVIFEGFTFLTPLQKYAIECSHEARIVIVAPYRPEQPRLFQAIKTTYEAWWGTARSLGTAPLASGPLGDVQISFDGSPRPADLSSDDLIARAHGHRNQEAAECIRAVQAGLDQGAGPREIVIVTPSRGSYDQLLIEEADRQELPVPLHVPPRLLLLTPVGRFALTLYQLWEHNRVEISVDQFHTMLASGWLGAVAQRTAGSIRSVADQWFSLCEDMSSWQAALDSLESANREIHDERTPSHWVEDEDISTWRDALSLIEDVTTRLFAPGRRPLGAHVRALLDELVALGPTQRFEAEQEVLLRIQEALEEAASSSSLPVDASEFGEVLVALAREYEQAGTEEDEVPEGRVWVTTPNGVDGVRRGIVIAIGFDGESIPRGFDPGWPLTAQELGRHLEVERYLFGAVLRAAVAQLRMSYSATKDGAPVGPSPYLRMLGFEAERVTPSQSVAIVDEPEPPARHIAARDEYTLEELAIHGLCPYRYRAERLDRRTGCHTDGFHLRLQASADWFDGILEAMAVEPPTRDWDAFRQTLLATFRDTEDATRARYPGLGPDSWRTVKRDVAGGCKYLLEKQAGRGYHLTIERLGPAGYDVILEERVVRVTAAVSYGLRSGVVVIPQSRSITARALGFPRKRGEASSTLVPQRGTNVFANAASAQYFMRDGIAAAYATRGDWNDAKARTIETAASLIAQVEHDLFPRNPGPHCHHCPVLDPCLGLDAA